MLKIKIFFFLKRTQDSSAGSFVCCFWLEATCFPSGFLLGTLSNCQYSGTVRFNVIIVGIPRYPPYFYSKNNSEGEYLPLQWISVEPNIGPVRE